MHITQNILDWVMMLVGGGFFMMGLGHIIEAIGMSRFFHAQAWEIRNAS